MVASEEGLKERFQVEKRWGECVLYWEKGMSKVQGGQQIDLWECNSQRLLNVYLAPGTGLF